MNDRLRIASEQLAAIMPTRASGWDDLIISEALSAADALIAAAGEKKARGPMPGEIDYAYLAQHNDALTAACNTARSKLATAEGIIEDLKAQLTAALADNERMRESAVSRLEYNQQVARAYAAEGIVDDLKGQIARLTRQLEPLTEEQARGLVGNPTAIGAAAYMSSAGWIAADAAIRAAREGER